MPAECRVDPGGRDGCRAPIPWDQTERHGWTTAQPWLPWPPDPHVRNAATEQGDPASMLHLYRRLLAARRRSPALLLGTMGLLPSPAGVLAYERAVAGDRRRVLVNFTGEPVEATVDGAWRVEVASQGEGEEEPFTGTVPASAAVLLAPAPG